MANHKYLPNPSKLFDEDDVDDDTFVNSFRSRIPPPQPASSKPYGGHIAEMDRQRQVMLERQREIEQRTLASSERSISLLKDSEDVGIMTAVELSRQREQLENTNKKLDDINTNLNYSQKHLNGIKSVFYGLKNYISGKSDQTPPKVQPSPKTRSVEASNSKLGDTIDNISDSSGQNSFRSHPTTRLRGLDGDNTAGPVTDSQRVNDILDANLDEMVQTITRLKGLGMALGEEIEHQNVLIDTIQDKVEVADIKIGKQNKDMNKLLGK